MCFILSQAVVSKEKPFAAQSLNLQLFDFILDRLAARDSSPHWISPALMVIPALIRSESRPDESVKLATLFMATLRGLVGLAKIRTAQKKDEDLNEPLFGEDGSGTLGSKSRIHSYLTLARRSGTISTDGLLHAAMEALDCVDINTDDWTSRQWAPLPSNSQDGQFVFLLTLFRFLMTGLSSPNSSKLLNGFVFSFSRGY